MYILKVDGSWVVDKIYCLMVEFILVFFVIDIVRRNIIVEGVSIVRGDYVCFF